MSGFIYDSEVPMDTRNSVSKQRKLQRRDVLLVDGNNDIFLPKQINFGGPLTHAFISIFWATDRISSEERWQTT